ncbi:MAG TPA: helical backbone metal receptor [Candidatus Limnocylindrales bacterium]|nr:helical backbone metal receptor [Candidatus Limnocylindrales bacterium]
MSRPTRVFLLSLALITAACSGAPPPSATLHVDPTIPTAFPLALRDDEGAEVTITAEPQTIVSLTPANTEIVYALGAGDRMRGGTDFDDFPAEAAALPDVVAGVQVLTEQIVAIDPDLVLAGGNNFTPAAEVERLRGLGITVLVVYPETVDEVVADIRLIGRAIGRHDEAMAITEGMEARIRDITSVVSRLEPLRTFYEIGYGPDIYGPAPNSFVADMVELAGGEAITSSDPAVFSISLEDLVDKDPEVIVLGDAAYGTCPETVPSRPGWDSMTAVADAAIRPVDDIVVTRPGPRLAEGLAALALAIHPDAQIKPPTAGAVLCADPGVSSTP